MMEYTEYKNPFKVGTKTAKVWDYIMSKMPEYMASSEPIETSERIRSKFRWEYKLKVSQSTVDKAVKNLPEEVHEALNKKKKDNRIYETDTERHNRLNIAYEECMRNRSCTSSCL